ncbi:MAG: fluoride efflux transporter CrcB [Alphaproteobacteria bacterium]|nr:fluoride efflux transporter CrcB [Alphaproteobacteria bacterium]
MNLKIFFILALGGIMGTIFRYGFIFYSVKIWGTHFPWGTLGINVIGSFLMGCFVALFNKFIDLPLELKLFLTTGLLGSFTTFSGFSFDFMNLWQQGMIYQSFFYILLSVFLSLGAVFLGYSIGRL